MIAKACNICKGQSTIKCMICGHKKKKPFFQKKVPLTKEEIRARDAKREEVMMHDQYSKNALIHGNYTTQLTVVDKRIEEHRKFTQELYQAHQSGKTIQSLGEKHGLTEKQIRTLLATALFQQNQGEKHTLKPEIPQKSNEETEAEFEEIRRKRDTPKPPRQATFAKMEYIDESEESDNGQ